MVFLYLPNRAALQELLVRNAVLQATARADAVVAIIERCREGAASLSSRTMLKRAIQDYYEGTRTLEETKKFHEGLYDDGARVLVWLTGAERSMDGQVVARYGNPLPGGHRCDHSGERMQLDFQFVERDEFIPGTVLGCADSLRVQSPVIQDGVVLGHDCLCYDLKDALDTVRSGPWNVSIVSAGEADALRAGTDSSFNSFSDTLFRVEDSIGLYASIPDSNSAVVVCTDFDDFFSSGFRLIRSTMIRFLLVLILLLATSNLFIVFVLHRLLKRLETSRDKWREVSMRDSLTGLYSRRSLDHWIDSELERETDVFTVVMIDLDDFKAINDTMGHDAGDAILMSFAPLVSTVLRSDDIAIRYGGDEFLLLLRKSDESIARAVMVRLEESLETVSVRDRSPGISWGMATLVPPATRKEFETAIHSADEEMYHMKRKHRNKR